MPPAEIRPGVSTLRQAGRWLAVVGVYAVVARLIIWLTLARSETAAVALESGLAVALLLAGGVRCWPALLLGAIAAKLGPGVPVGGGLADAVGVTIEGAAGAWIFGRVARVRPGVAGEIGAIAAAAGLAPIGALAVGIVSGRGEAVSVAAWLGHALGILAVAPLGTGAVRALVKGGAVKGGRIASRLELAALVAVAGGACAQGFFWKGGVGFWMLGGPVLLLAMTWFGAGGVRVMAALLAGVAVLTAAAGVGPFGGLEPAAAWVAVFVGAVGVVALVLPLWREPAGFGWPAAVLLAGWALSGWMFSTLQRQREAEDRANFAQLAANAESEIQRRMDSYVELLRAGAGVVATDEKLERPEWRGFVETADIARRHPGLRRLGVVLAVPDDEVAAFERQRRAEGLVGFSVHPLPGRAPVGGEHFVATFAAPEGDATMLGLDFATEPRRRGAAERARDTGRPQMTDSLALVQDELQRAGFLIFSPAYRMGMPRDSVEQRRAALVGWVYAPFLMEEFLQEALGRRAEKLQLHIFDGGEPVVGRLLQPAGAREVRLPPYERVSRLELAGRTFTFGWRRGAGFVPASPSPMWWTAGSLTVMSVLLFALVASFQRTGRRAQRIAEERTAALVATQGQLETANRLQRAVLDGTEFSIVATGLDGVIEVFNRGAEQMLGYAREELIGQATPVVFHVPREVEARAEELSRRFGRTIEPGFGVFVASVQQGGPDEREWTYVRKDGTRLPVLLTISARHDAAGQITGFLGIARDLTSRKKAEEALLASEERLQQVLRRADCLVWEAIVRLTDRDWDWRITIHPSGLHERLFGTADVGSDAGLWYRFNVPEREEMNRRSREAMESGKGGYVNEFRLLREDGVWWLRESVAIRRTEDGGFWLVGVVFDVTKEKRTEAVLQESEERFRSAFEWAGIGMALVGLDGRFLKVNATLCEILGYTEAELLARRFQDITHPDDVGADAALMRELQDGRVRSYQLEKRCGHRSGRIVWIRLTGSMVRAPDGQPLQFVGQIEDITERKRLEDSLARARDEALAASRLKSEFMASLSHEIRTPMNGIIGMASLLGATQLEPQQRQMSMVILRSAEGLLHIINDILDFSKIEAGRMRIEPEAFALRPLVEETLALLAPRANDKRLELVGDFDPRLSQPLVGDRGRIGQVITNLVGNAIKFTDTGEVLVRVVQMDDSEGRTSFRVLVSDTGVGIPAAAQAQLFQPFVQADGSSTRRFGGTGLGLAISRQLVELMGGDIGFESEPGRGSTFWFELELPQGPAEPVREETLQARLRVLVVDDSATARQVLGVQLGRLGARAELAADGAEALARLRTAAAQDAFQLVFLDDRMPAMHGLALAAAIRAEPGLAATPLILLSTGEGPLGGPEFEAAHFAAVLAKPVSEAELRRTVLPFGTATAAAAAPMAAPPAAGRRLNVLLVEDNPTNQLVIKLLAGQLGHRVDCANDGREALARLAHARYDVVLMDCQMPELDGYETTRRIRSGAEAVLDPRVPVVALTAYAMMGDKEQCLAAGMNDYLSKPVRMEELQAALLRAATGAATEPAPPPAPPVIAAKFDEAVLDLKVLENLRALPGRNGPRLVPEILELFCREEPERRAGLGRLVEQRDAVELAKAAHAFAGSSAIVGARAARQALLALERAARAEAWDEIPRLLAEVNAAGARLREALLAIEPHFR